MNSPERAEDAKLAHWLTEYMLHLDEKEALRFLECIVIKWAQELPRDQLGQLNDELLHLNNDNTKCAWSEAKLRGYALYRIAAGLEH